MWLAVYFLFNQFECNEAFTTAHKFVKEIGNTQLNGVSKTVSILLFATMSYTHVHAPAHAHTRRRIVKRNKTTNIFKLYSCWN